MAENFKEHGVPQHVCVDEIVRLEYLKPIFCSFGDRQGVLGVFSLQNYVCRTYPIDIQQVAIYDGSLEDRAGAELESDELLRQHAKGAYRGQRRFEALDFHPQDLRLAFRLFDPFLPLRPPKEQRSMDSQDLRRPNAWGAL